MKSIISFLVLALTIGLVSCASSAELSFQRTSTKYGGVFQAVEASGRWDFHSLSIRQTIEPAGDTLGIRHQASFEPWGPGSYTVFGNLSYVNNSVFDQEYVEGGVGAAISLVDVEGLRIRPSIAFLVRDRQLVTSLWLRAKASYDNLSSNIKITYAPEKKEMTYSQGISYRLSDLVSLGYRYDYTLVRDSNNWTDSAQIKFKF